MVDLFRELHAQNAWTPLMLCISLGVAVALGFLLAGPRKKS